MSWILKELKNVAEEGRVDLAESLLQAGGVTIYEKKSDRWTVLYAVAHQGHVAVAHGFLVADAKVKSLMNCLAECCLQGLQLLIAMASQCERQD